MEYFFLCLHSQSMCALESKMSYLYIKKGNRLTNIENKLMNTSGEREGGGQDRGMGLEI